MTQIQTTDLNYAALLVCFGAEVDRVELCGRYAKIHLSVHDGALGRAQDKLQRAQRLFERCESLQEMSVAYEQSVLHDVSNIYYSLKRRVAREREQGQK